jgi:hypothetical protein
MEADSIKIPISVDCNVENGIMVCKNTKPIVSKETAIASITALRHFNKILEKDAERYRDDPNNLSSYQSVMRIKKSVETAYDELQMQTGDTTPLGLR